MSLRRASAGCAPLAGSSFSRATHQLLEALQSGVAPSLGQVAVDEHAPGGAQQEQLGPVGARAGGMSGFGRQPAPGRLQRAPWRMQCCATGQLAHQMKLPS